MRPLNQRQASECETATTTRCQCRCGGALHGARRTGWSAANFFKALPDSDPHVVNGQLRLEFVDDERPG